MKKNKFIKSTIILIIGGFITKILGMVIKIIITRNMTTEGMGLYSLINPTFILLISIATLGLPTAISKIISTNKHNNKNILFNSVVIILIINILLFLTILFSAHFISNHLLNEPRTFYPILSIAFVLPFISISSILRGYFFGKEKFFPHSLSNILEDITKLISIILFLPFYLAKGLEYAVSFLILTNIISEVTTIITLLFFVPKKTIIKKEDFRCDKSNIKSLLNISIPTTGSRLISAVGMFIEPIIVTTILLNIGYQNDFILNEYGILNGYVIPLILLPSFFTFAISQALLPVVSNGFANKKKKYLISKIKQAITISLCIGIPATLIFTFIPEIPLQLIFNTDKGLNYIKILAPIFLIFYIQAPLTSCMLAMNLAKDAMIGTFVGIILKILILLITLPLKIGLWPLVISSTINVIYVTLHHIHSVIKKIKTLS